MPTSQIYIYNWVWYIVWFSRSAHAPSPPQPLPLRAISCFSVSRLCHFMLRALNMKICSALCSLIHFVSLFVWLPKNTSNYTSLRSTTVNNIVTRLRRGAGAGASQPLCGNLIIYWQFQLMHNSFQLIWRANACAPISQWWQRLDGGSELLKHDTAVMVVSLMRLNADAVSGVSELRAKRVADSNVCIISGALCLFLTLSYPLYLFLSIYI